MKIVAKLRPPSNPRELTVDECLERINHARAEATHLLRSYRSRAAAFAKGARRRARSRGYQQGLVEAHLEVRSRIEGIHEAYSEAAEAAKAETLTLAYHLAESLIADSLKVSPEPYVRWLSEALEVLKECDHLTLQYHPRCEHALKGLKKKLPKGVAVVENEQLHDVDFRLESAQGAVECAWQKALRAQYSHEG